MSIVLTDGQIPASFYAALGDRSWRRAFEEYLRGLGREAAGLIASVDTILACQGVSDQSELTSLAYGATLSARTKQLVAAAYRPGELARALEAMKADINAQGEELYAGFVERSEEVLARIVEPKRLRSLNEQLLKATDAGSTLYWLRIGEALYLTETAAAYGNDERHVFFERNADETGTLEVLSRGRGTDPGSLRVTGASDPIGFKQTLREFTKKKVEFDDSQLLGDPDELTDGPSRVPTAEQDAADGGALAPPAPDVPAPDQSAYRSQGDLGDGSEGGYDNAAEEAVGPPPTLEEAWTSEWAPTFIEWARQQDAVYDCLEAVNEYKSSGSPEYRDLILQNWVGPFAVQPLPLAEDLVERAATAGSTSAAEEQPFSELEQELWVVLDQHYTTFAGLYH